MKSFLRRMIALVLIAAMLFSLGCEAFAQTLTLPAALEEIEEEAFYGDESLDEVVVPYGATTIGPRAFAWSGLNKITIPNTVTEIEEDAFEGLSDDFTIFAPQYSKAYDYAVSNQFQWVDSERTRIQLLADILDSVDTNESEPVMTLDELKFEPLSTEGVTDPEELRLIQEFNAGQEELAALTSDLIHMRDELEAGLNAYQDYISESQVDVSEDGIHTHFGDFEYSIAGDAWQDLGEDAELVGVEMLEDGSQIMIFMSSDQPVYLKSTESSLFRVDGTELGDVVESREYVISNGDADTFVFTISQSPAFRGPMPSRHPILEAIVDYFSDALNNFTNLCQSVDKFFEDTYGGLTRWLNTARFNYNGIDKLYRANPAKYAAKHADFLAELETAQRCFNAFARAKAFWAGLSLYSSVRSLGTDFDRVRLILDLYGHGHPTDQEAQDYQKITLSRDLSGSLANYSVILGAKIAFTTTEIVSSLNTLISLLTTASGPGGWGIKITIEASILMAKTFLKIAAKSIAIGLVTDAAEAQSRNVVLSLDARLHGEDPDTNTIGGIITTDDSTQKPIYGVRVTLDNIRSTTTDAQGSYAFSEVSDGKHTLRCSKTGYVGIKQDIVASIDSTVFDISMECIRRTLSGTVTDSSTGAGLSGVTVTLDGERTTTTGSSGAYSFSNVEYGAHSLRFDKSGYASETVQLKEGQYSHNQPLSQKTYTVSGIVKDQSTGGGLAGAVVTLDGSRTTTSGAGGRYSFSKVKAGSHTLVASRTDYNNKRVNITVQNDVDNIDFIMTSETVPESLFDPAFWAWCVKQYDGTYDAATQRIVRDGQLSKQEIAAVRSIDCRGMGFRSVIGVKIFSELEQLNCAENQLTSIDVSGCSKLRSMACHENQLTSINISGCSMLSTLHCAGNRLSSLNVSNHPALTVLMAWDNEFTSLNLSGCSSLTDLGCERNQLTSLNLSGCTGLTTLHCFENQLTSLNLSDCRALNDLGCWENQLTTLNLSGYLALSVLSCQNNQLTYLNVSGCSALTDLDCSNNQLTSIVASGCSALEKLMCYNNKLTSLNVSGCSALAELDCGYNQLASISASGCSALTDFNYYGNPIKSLNLSGCSALVNFECAGVGLESLDVSNCTSLPALACPNNQLTDLNVSGCSALTDLNCGLCELTTLNLSGCTALETLACPGNQLTSLDASDCSNLTGVWVYDNSLTSLDLSGCTRMTELDCAQNQLTDLNVSGCSALERLMCNNNKLTSLNVSGCSALAELDCGYNQLASISASGCSALTDFNYYGNPIKSLNLSGCSALVNFECAGVGLESLDVSNCTSLPALACPNNQLTDLNVSGCSALTDLNCGLCELTTLNLSGCTALETLACPGNQLTSLDASDCSNLTGVWVYDNSLTSLDLSGCTRMTELDCARNQLTDLNVSGCSALTELVCDRNQLTEINVSGCSALTDENIQCDAGVIIVR